MRRSFSYQRAGLVTPALIFLLVTYACATTTTAQQDAFKGLQTIRVGVEASLKVFNAGYQAGTYSENQRTQLHVLYDKYLQGDTVAAELLASTMTTDPGEVIGRVTLLASDVIKFVQTLKGSP